jgi:hypothetical protein
MALVILFLAGVGLCIMKHPVWGGICIAIAAIWLIL